MTEVVAENQKTPEPIRDDPRIQDADQALVDEHDTQERLILEDEADAAGMVERGE